MLVLIVCLFIILLFFLLVFSLSVKLLFFATLGVWGSLFNTEIQTTTMVSHFCFLFQYRRPHKLLLNSAFRFPACFRT